MSNDRELFQQALDVLIKVGGHTPPERYFNELAPVIDVLRSRLAQPEGPDYKSAYEEWQKATDWMQEPQYLRGEWLGRHRADILSELARRALAQPEVEPVAWVYEFHDPDPQSDIEFGAERPKGWPAHQCYPLYASPRASERRDAEKYRALHTPEIHNFIDAIEREALYQREKWGSSHDAGKTDADWFWLIGHLAGKALLKPEKALHHIITTAAACLNWHAAKLGTHTAMRPGIGPDKQPPKPAAPNDDAIERKVRG